MVGDDGAMEMSVAEDGVPGAEGEAAPEASVARNDGSGAACDTCPRFLLNDVVASVVQTRGLAEMQSTRLHKERRHLQQKERRVPMELPGRLVLHLPGVFPAPPSHG